MRLAPDGKIIWGPAAVLSALCLIISLVLFNHASPWIAAFGSLPFILTAVFFRDPEREVPQVQGAVVAPADGRIIKIARNSVAGNGEGKCHCISIFMSPLNVHINRIPYSGLVKSLQYKPGKFLTAFHEKASSLNEQQLISLQTQYGEVSFVQIAGWLARRIVCRLELDQMVEAGERFGLIRFGSRVDLYLPANCVLKVALRQKVRAGETVIGVLNEKK